MIGRSTTLRGRLTLWYTGILTAMLALLGATSVMLLDHGLRNNVDDSLNSVARRHRRVGPASVFFRLRH